MPSTLTTFDAFLKERYDDGQKIELIAEEHPFLDKLIAQGIFNGSGDVWVVPFVDSDAQGVGATLAKAQSNATNLGGAKWMVNWGDYIGVANIGHKVMKASSSDVGAFFENSAAEIDSVYRTFGDQLSLYLLRDHGHALCKGTVHVSSGLVTLSSGYESEIVNVKVGMIIYPSAGAGTATTDEIISSAGAGYVISVNENAGTFVVSTTATGSGATPANWTGTMYFFRDGDFGGTTTPNRIVDGFADYVPAVDPTTTFNNVDRSVSPLKRGGVRLTTTEVAGLSIEDRIKTLHTRMASRGPGSHCRDGYLHPEKWQALATSLESRGNRPIDGKAGIFSYNKIQLATSQGMIDIWSDRQMPIDAYYAPDFRMLKLAALEGDFPGVVNDDGLTMLRKATAAAGTGAAEYEHRIFAYPGFCVKGPGACGRAPV